MLVKRGPNSGIFGLPVPRVQASQPTRMRYRPRIDLVVTELAYLSEGKFEIMKHDQK